MDHSSDIRELRRRAKALPKLDAAIDSYLEDYIALFPEPCWRKLYDGPSVLIDQGNRRAIGYELAFLLEIVRWYKLLKEFDGAMGLIAKLRNPTQVSATFFEIETAGFCATRSATKYLKFEPEIQRNGRVKRPDFLWSTALGDLYGECKQVGVFEDTFRNRVEALVSFVGKELDARPVVADLRYDFLVERTGGAESSILALLAQAHGATTPKKLSHKGVTLFLNAKDTAPPGGGAMVRSTTVPSSTTPTNMSPQAARSTVSVLATKYWETVCRRLIRDARTRLPTDAPGAIMLGLGLASEHAMQATVAKVQQLVGQPAFQNTPWVAVWDRGGMNLTHRNGQPFDARLCEPLDVRW